MNLEEVFTELLALAADEDRVPDRVEINRATNEQFMVRVYFVGEVDFEPLHILPAEEVG